MRPFARLAACLCALLCLAVPVRAARLITLSAPDNFPANGRVPLTVFGDSLGAAQVRVWRVVSMAEAAPQQGRNLVYQAAQGARRGRTDVTFYAPLKQPGLYLAQARSGRATHAEFFHLVAVQRVVRTIQVSAPGNIVPARRVPFTVSSSGFTLGTAGLRIWRVGEGAQRGQTLVFAGNGRRAKKEYGVTIRAPLMQAGLYLAQAQSGSLRAVTYLRVSDMGIVTKRAPRELLVYAVRLTTGRPMPGAAIRVDDLGLKRYDNRTEREVWVRRPGAPRAGAAASDGVAQFGGTPDNGGLRVVATAPDGSRAQADAPLAQEQENDLRVFFYTERPVYRPGQKVFFKGIVRRDLTVGGRRAQGSQYAPVRHYPVQIEITDATNKKVETLQLRTNARGSFAGEAEIGEEAPIGFYSVQMKIAPPQRPRAEPQLFYGRFSVQEYRKPEFEVTPTALLDPARPWARQGQDFEVRVEARYFFGAPVKGAKLVYSGAASGETKLDEQGQAKIKVANPQELESDSRRGQDITRQLHFAVTDESNRVVESDLAVFAPWSEIKPSLSSNREIYSLRDTAQLTVLTRDPLDRPVAARAKVRLFYFRQRKVKDRETLRETIYTDEVEFWNTTLQTDRSGRGLASVRLGRAGYIKATVETIDANQRAVTSEADFWVTTPGQRQYYGFNFPSINILLDKPSSAPGQTVRALIVTDTPGGSALVTLQSDRIWLHRVVRLSSNATPIEFIMPAAASPGAHLTAGLVHQGDWASASAYIKAFDPAQRLDIKVQPAKAQFRPGETALYTISARDGQGRPQAAEISLGFVDKAIYGIATDETPDPLDFFYGPRPDRVATSWFLPRELPGGSYQRIERAVPIRRKFEDTAFWNPFVQTDARGLATLSFPLPDNLTTWRATARGVTFDTKVGAATQETLVTKPLLVRLELPRFAVQDDRVQAQVIVQNNTSLRQNLRVSLRSEGAQVSPGESEVQGSQRGTVEAGGSAKFYWTMSVPDVPAGGLASFTATARGEGAQGAAFEDSTDAMQLAIAVKPHGVRVRSWRAGLLAPDATSAEAVLTQPAGLVRNSSRLDIHFSPSLAGPMLSALPHLQGFPYGCTEQTLSRFVPAVVAARALQKLGKPLPAAMKDLPKQVKQGLALLAALQHEDGGWGWWKEDDTDPFLSGYVLYGLGLAAEAGYRIDRTIMVRGLRSLQNQFQADKRVRAKAGEPRGSEVALVIAPDTRAWMMLGYATAIGAAGIAPDELFDNGVGAGDDYLGAVFNVRDTLSNYGLASLALAYGRLDRAERTRPRVIILGGLAARRYLLDTHRNKKGVGGGGKYFESKSGRLFYLNAQGGSVYVSIPDEGIAVPEAGARAYRGLKGYALRPARREFAGYAARGASLGTLLALLETRARTENTPGGTGTSWPSLVSDAGWRDSDIETTALAAQALIVARPNSPLILGSLRWLMAQRQGDIWQSTKDTAQVVITLADFLQNSPELAPDETVRVLVNGIVRQTVRFTAADIGASDQELRLDGLNEDARVRFEREGKGAVYFSTRLIAYTSSGLDAPEDNGFHIERRYAIRNAEGFWREVSGPLPNGELVRVELRITTTKPREYVLLEDPMPAGFEAREIDDAKAWVQEVKVDPDCTCRNIVLDPPPGWSQMPITRRETRDDRVAFFSSYLGGSDEHPGRYLARYILRPESTGTRTALPARIELMYRPDINGRSAQNSVEVK